MSTNLIALNQINANGNLIINASSTGNISISTNGASGIDVAKFTSGSNGSVQTNDVSVYRFGSTASVVGKGPSVTFGDLTGGTYSQIGHYGGQTELWQFNTSWNQIWKIDSSGGMSINAPSGAVPSLNIAGNNTVGQYALRVVANTAALYGNFTNLVDCDFNIWNTPGGVASKFTSIGPSVSVAMNLLTNNTARVQISSTGAVSFNAVSTTASAGNAFLDSAANNNLLRSTSSIRYKQNVESILPEYFEKTKQLRPVWYRSKADADKKEWSYFGLISEEVAEIEPRLVHYTKDEEGNLTPDSVQYDRIAVLLLGRISDLENKLEEATQRINELEKKLI